MELKVLDSNSNVRKYSFSDSTDYIIESEKESMSFYDIWTENPDVNYKTLDGLQQLLKNKDHTKVCVAPASWIDSLNIPYKLGNKRRKFDISFDSETSHFSIPQELPNGFHFKDLIFDVEILSEILFRSDPTCLEISWAKNLLLDIKNQEFGHILKSSQALFYRDELIGACIMTLFFETPLLTHYFIDPKYQGKGLASSLLNYCMLETYRIGFKKIVGSLDDDNIASYKAIQKINAKDIVFQDYQILICNA